MFNLFYNLYYETSKTRPLLFYNNGLYFVRQTFSTGICLYFTKEEHTTVVFLNESLMISSNNYPNGYPTLRHLYDNCVRKFEAAEGLLSIRLMDTKLAVGDILAVGTGIIPFFDNAVYGIATALKSPVRDNHPRGIYIKPSKFFGLKMWIIFQPYRPLPPSLFQFSTRNTGFLLEISSVLESGKYNLFMLLNDTRQVLLKGRNQCCP